MWLWLLISKTQPLYYIFQKGLKFVNMYADLLSVMPSYEVRISSLMPVASHAVHACNTLLQNVIQKMRSIEISWASFKLNFWVGVKAHTIHTWESLGPVGNCCSVFFMRILSIAVYTLVWVLCPCAGLSQFATEDSLAEAFSRYGQVIEGLSSSLARAHFCC